MRAYVFPGQGSQFPGMGYELYKNNKKAKEIFNYADEILGFKLSEIMFKGNEEELKSTEIAQLAIFIHSLAISKAMEIFRPEAVAGHSLGEYSALASVNSISLKDCLVLIKERALNMKKASEINPGKMAAIIGLDNNEIEKVCEDINQEESNKVYPANYNCPGQVVISGNEMGISLASEELKRRGAKRIVELKVSGAFHTKMMEPAKIGFEKILNKIKINKPQCPIYQNVDGKATEDPEQIRNNLLNQITSPVLWTQTIQNMIKNGYNSFEEIGPGKVLKGLIVRIDKQANVLSPEIVYTKSI